MKREEREREIEMAQAAQELETGYPGELGSEVSNG
jgi:hypothetical protein